MTKEALEKAFAQNQSKAEANQSVKVKSVSSDSASSDVVKVERKAEIDAAGRSYGTGRRKDSVARVWIKPGSGKITINGREDTNYFGRPVLRMIINQPFVLVNSAGNFDVNCTVKGGGSSGQAGAIRLGISRALVKYNPDNHKQLRHGGFLTRDSRTVERKKYGKKKARKSFQFSKR